MNDIVWNESAGRSDGSAQPGSLRDLRAGEHGWGADGVRAFGVNSVCTATVCPCLYELSIPVRVVAMSGCAVILEAK